MGEMIHEIVAGLSDIKGAEFWVLVAFVLFLILVWRVGGFGQLTAALDKRGNDIRHELDEAKALREEAQRLLTEYQRRQREAEAEAEAMLKAAREEAERLKAESATKAQDYVTRRTKIAEQKIAQAESQAITDVRAAAADAAVSAAASLLGGQVRNDGGGSIQDAAIREVASKLQ